MIDELIQELRSYPTHYVAAHRAADALEKAAKNAHAREYHNIYLEDQLIKLEQAAESLREHIAQQQLDIVTLGQEVGRLREALMRWQCYGCPDCGDDCSSSENAIFANCILRQTRAALGEEKK